MNAIAFDTLALARKLEAAGFTGMQAQGAAALAEALSEVIATRRDLNEMEARQNQTMSRIDASIRSDLARTEASLRSDLNELSHRLTIRLGGMVAASIAIVAASVKLL